MRKYLIFIVIFLSCLTANAQQEDDVLVSLAKVNFEGMSAPFQWFYFFNIEAGTSMETVEEGIAITNPHVQDQAWTPSAVVLPEGLFNLEENHDYIIRLTIKVPSDGTYQVILGSWNTNYSCYVNVKAGNEFQIIDTEYPEYGRSIDDAHVLIGFGWVEGTTIIKEVEVLEKRVTTGIQSVNSAKDAKDAIYNLAGQKVSTSYKGIVIKNGKRVVIR